MGIMLMFCTPPATIRSLVPDFTACAAKCSACWLDPHCRSMVVPGISSGSPAASQHVRAMSPAWGPMASTQPKNTSSTASGSTPVRSSTYRRSPKWSKFPRSGVGLAGGSDCDVKVGKDNAVYLADLQIFGSDVLKSTDDGATFAATSRSEDPVEQDRQWLAPDPTDP